MRKLPILAEFRCPSGLLLITSALLLLLSTRQLCLSLTPFYSNVAMFFGFNLIVKVLLVHALD